MANGAPSPTPAADWAPTRTVELPSGKHARLREKLSLRALVRRGDLELEELSALTAGGLQDAQRALEIEALLLAEMFVDPKLIVGERKAGKGSVHIDSLEDDDCSFVLELALGGAPDLATFRSNGGSGGAGTDGDGVEEEPERAARARSRKSGGVGARQPARAAPRKSRSRS